jgi:hypothetical protein
MSARNDSPRIAVILISLVAFACSPGPTKAPATAEPPAVQQPVGLVLGCAGVAEAECQHAAARLQADLPQGRRQPFDIQISLGECPNEDPCPRTIAARGAIAYAEYAGGFETLTYSLGGEPDNLGPLDFAFTEPIAPSSARVAGGLTFPFDLGHCGLSHMVDFDGSFWVAFGQIDGDAFGLINSESGQMRLLGSNVAQYTGPTGFIAQLVRFPGHKRFFYCA